MYITTIPKPLLITMVLWTMPRTCSSIQTDMDRLYEDVFQNYSHKTLPVLAVSEVVVVEVTAYIVNVNNFNELHGELSVTMAFWMKWTENRIHWNISDYGGITSMAVLPEDVWRPRVFLLQASDTITDICNTSIQPILNNNGSVHWLSSKVLKISCSVDVAHFPFDTQTCMLSFISWSFTLESLILYPENTRVRTEFFNDNSQWEIRPSFLQSCTEYKNTPCLNVTIVLKRRSEFFMFYIIIPLLFLGLINNLVFIMPPTSGERTSVAVTTFLSFVVYMDMVNDVVPQSSRPMALMYYYITALLIYSSTIMFLCIVSLRIYDRKNCVPSRLQTAVWIAGFHFIKRRKETVVAKSIKGRIVYSTSDDFITENESSIRGPENETCTVEEMRDNICKWICTWKTVGKTFDCYCFTLLYVTLATVSTIMTYYWMNA